MVQLHCVNVNPEFARLWIEAVSNSNRLMDPIAEPLAFDIVEARHGQRYASPVPSDTRRKPERRAGPAQALQRTVCTRCQVAHFVFEEMYTRRNATSTLA